MLVNVDTHGCNVAVRRFRGPLATELFVHCQPPALAADPQSQAAAVYRALAEVLEAAGGTFTAVVSETVFLRDPAAIEQAVRATRQHAFANRGVSAARQATMMIGQSPLDPHAHLEVMVHAVLPRIGPARLETVTLGTNGESVDGSGAQALVLHLGEQARFHAAGLCGAGNDAYEQTRAMFLHAEALLQRAGMEFSDVVRTWIHLQHMQRDYAAFNHARRDFFTARGIRPYPASTGIHGALASPQHDLCLGVYAVKSAHARTQATVMSSATLNEAADYGADFTRGLKVAESNRIALHVSGTASVDEQGRTAHVGDFDAQAERMLVNIAALLERQDANFGDVVSAITYLKNPADAARLRRKLDDAGFTGFPHALVEAEVCRPELLCETEALALLPVATGRLEASAPIG